MEGDRYENNLQFKLKEFAKEYDNIFIIAVFDCCRNRKDKPKPVASKGENNQDEFDVQISSKG